MVVVGWTPPGALMAVCGYHAMSIRSLRADILIQKKKRRSTNIFETCWRLTKVDIFDIFANEIIRKSWLQVSRQISEYNVTPNVSFVLFGDFRLEGTTVARIILFTKISLAACATCTTLTLLLMLLGMLLLLPLPSKKLRYKPGHI